MIFRKNEEKKHLFTLFPLNSKHFVCLSSTSQIITLIFLPKCFFAFNLFFDSFGRSFFEFMLREKILLRRVANVKTLNAFLGSELYRTVPFQFMVFGSASSLHIDYKMIIFIAKP